jgi:hypothetical protein
MFKYLRIKVLVGLLLTTSFAWSQQQDQICSAVYPPPPQCSIPDGRVPAERDSRPQFTPNQIDQMMRDNERELQRQHDAQLHACEVREEREYQACVNRGGYCSTMQTCF